MIQGTLELDSQRAGHKGFLLFRQDLPYRNYKVDL